VLRACYRGKNEVNVPDVCVHILDRSEFCFVPGSLKVLYLRNVGCVRVRVRRKVHMGTYLLLNTFLEGLDLFENLTARRLVARLLGAQFIQLSTKGVSLLISLASSRDK